MPIDFSLLDVQLAPIPRTSDDVGYLREHVREFISRVDAQEELATQRVLPLPFGTWNVACHLQPADLVLKLSPWGSRHEADFLQAATATGAAVPRFITYGVVPDDVLPGASYVLMEYIERSVAAGPLFERGALTAPQLLAMGTDAGATLARIHAVAFPYVRSFDTPQPDWGACLGLWELAETPLFDRALLARFEHALSDCGYRERTHGTLAHSDASPHNILVDEDSHAFRALIDPGPEIVSSPMYDLAYAAQPWIYGGAYLERVVAGYQAAGGTLHARDFAISLLCVAYRQSQWGGAARGDVRAYLEQDVLPLLDA
ncbi:MAG: Phosphotransferase enzyme family [Chloroflexota bacterium]|jgi:hypothetical protein